MRVTFYAPLKPPDHPVPSGDRRMAALLVEAMARGGHEVELASRLRSRDAEGDQIRQTRLSRIGQGLAERLLHRYMRRPAVRRPQLWFTYHLYYKAPDWIGPRVAAGLDIPYVVAEASVAPKRAGGPWDPGHRATLAALDQATSVIALNPLDIECLPDKSSVRILPPFIETDLLRTAAAQRAGHRKALAVSLGLKPESPWLVAVAMMRPGDKLDSYRLLAEALQLLSDLSWQLLIVGDGPARKTVETVFAPIIGATIPARVSFRGALEAPEVAAALAACDIMVWPAINEAYGIALLEAQAAGLPVIAGRTGGVPAIVCDGETGILTAPQDSAAFAAALRELLLAPDLVAQMGKAASARVEADHSLESAVPRLDAILREALEIGPRRSDQPARQPAPSGHP